MTKPDLSAIPPAVDRVLRVLVPDALDAAGLHAHAARLRAMRPVKASSGSYAADVVHAAFAEARKQMHAAMAAGDAPRARALSYAGALAHAGADACAMLGASAAGGPHFLHVAAKNAQEAERIAAEAEQAPTCPIG